MRAIIGISAAMLLAAGLLVQPADAQRERQQQDRNQSTWQQDQRQTQQTRMQQGQLDEQTSLRLAKAKDLLGMEVQNFQDEELGSIEELVLDKQRQKVSYVVISTGGFLGIGQKYHAVPFQAFQVLPPDEDDDDIDLVLNLSADHFDQAQGFDKKNWPDQPNPQFHRTGAQGSQYGYQHDRQDEYAVRDQQARRQQDQQVRSQDQPKEQKRDKQDKQARQAQQQPGQDIESRRVSKIVGTEVATGQQQELGKVEDLVIDLQQGRVAYALVSVDDDDLDIEEGMIALPWSGIRHQGEFLVIQVQPQQLRELAFDDSQGLVRLENRTYAARMHERTSSRPYWEGGDQQMASRDQGMTSRQGQGQQTTQFRGTIERIESEGRGRNQELVLHVRTTEGKQMAVRVGPEWYARDRDVSFREGEQVTITGFVTGEGRQGRGQGRQMLVASVIQTGDQTLELRDSQGRPSWEQGETARRPRNR